LPIDNHIKAKPTRSDTAVFFVPHTFGKKPSFLPKSLKARKKGLDKPKETL
jgi:hypothetical protein